MGDGTKKNPYTRKDMLRLIKENGGTAVVLDLSGKVFEEGINLTILNLQEIILGGTHLEGANLEGAHLEGAYLWGTHLEGAYLWGTHLEGADLEGAHLEGANLGRAHLEGAYLRGTHLAGAKLAGIEFPPNTKLDGVDWGNYKIGEELSENFQVAGSIYRRLKQWYTNAGLVGIAAKFYYREKEVSRKALKWRSKDWHHRLAAEFMRALFGYGEDWRRILGWMAAFLILFAAAYYFWGKLELLDSLYFSAVSFTALGYGSWVKEATGWVKVLGAFEAFVGVFMMALLLVTFVRQWTR
jgi:hypothetical protein